MKILLYLTFLIFTFNSCSTDSNEINDWNECKKQASIQALFNYSLNHTSSAYLDSALRILNDSIKQDSYFGLTYRENSNQFFKRFMTDCLPREDHVFLININTGKCLYNDTLITAKDSITSKLDWFISLGFNHFVYIYSDSISSRKSWISLFGEIKEITNIYNSVRERYSINKWQVEYGKLGPEKQKLVKEEIPISLSIFFSCPYPPSPPPAYEFHEESELLDKRNKILLVTNAIANAGLRVR